jgi:hypothetical protein
LVPLVGRDSFGLREALMYCTRKAQGLKPSIIALDGTAEARALIQTNLWCVLAYSAPRARWLHAALAVFKIKQPQGPSVLLAR